MDRITATRYLLTKANNHATSNSEKRGRRGAQVGLKSRADLAEDELIDALDKGQVSEKFVATLQEIMDGKRSVKDGLDAAVIPALLEMMIQMRSSPSEKQRMDAAKDFLDRAGHSKVQKVHNMNEDLGANADPVELISAISGLIRETRVEKAIDVEAEDIE